MNRPMATRRTAGSLDELDDQVERRVEISLEWIAVVFALAVLLGACIGIYAAERAQARAAATEIVQP